MNKDTVVSISDMKIVKIPDRLVTYALGSCVGICLIDSMAQVAGMLHVLLPTNNTNDKSNLFKYADTGIIEMIRQMERMGALRIRMTAKIAGGAKMFEIRNTANGTDIGNRNVTATKEALKKLNIKLIAEDTGSNYGRTITFDSSNGSLEIKTFSNNSKTI